MISLSEKRIVITGASSGIGRACAVLTASFGAEVILVARSSSRLEETRSMMQGEKHQTIIQDITEYEATSGALQKVIQTAGKISGFIHAAGIEITKPLNLMKPADYEAQFSVNVIAGFELARLLSKKKALDDHGGSYVFISSTMGRVGQAGLAGYCSSKGALISGSKALALELAPKGVRVNCVCPGHVEGTQMSDSLFTDLPEAAREAIVQAHPLGLGTPEDVANACVFLLSDAARWITGAVLSVDGGYTAK